MLSKRHLFCFNSAYGWNIKFQKAIANTPYITSENNIAEWKVARKETEKKEISKWEVRGKWVKDKIKGEIFKKEEKLGGADAA